MRVSGIEVRRAEEHEFPESPRTLTDAIEAPKTDEVMPARQAPGKVRERNIYNFVDSTRWVRASVPDFVPASGWENIGNGDAQALLETYLWAATNGEVEVLAGLISIVGKPDYDDLYKIMSGDMIEKYRSPASLTALMVASQAADIAAVNNVVINFTSSESVSVTATFSDTAGNTRSQGFWLHQRPEGWRVEIFATSMNDSFDKLMGRTPKLPRPK